MPLEPATRAVRSIMPSRPKQELKGKDPHHYTISERVLDTGARHAVGRSKGGEEVPWGLLGGGGPTRKREKKGIGGESVGHGWDRGPSAGSRPTWSERGKLGKSGRSNSGKGGGGVFKRGGGKGGGAAPRAALGFATSLVVSRNSEVGGGVNPFSWN